MMKRGASLTEAARANRISRERLRRYLQEHTESVRKGRVWIIRDTRKFQLPIYSRGRVLIRWWHSDQASLVGQYLQAVGRFLPTGNTSTLDPFRGEGATDAQESFHPFETDENTLYRLDSAGEASIPEIYKTDA
jgi:hypothetical protein